jgi:hypothetical protein
MGLLRGTDRGPLSGFELLPHGFEILMRAVHSDHADVHQAWALSLLGEHGREHARDDVTIFPNGVGQRLRRQIAAAADFRGAASATEMT